MFKCVQDAQLFRGRSPLVEIQLLDCLQHLTNNSDKYCYLAYLVSLEKERLEYSPEPGDRLPRPSTIPVHKIQFNYFVGQICLQRRFSQKNVQILGQRSPDQAGLTILGMVKGTPHPRDPPQNLPVGEFRFPFTKLQSRYGLLIKCPNNWKLHSELTQNLDTFCIYYQRPFYLGLLH